MGTGAADVVVGVDIEVGVVVVLDGESVGVAEEVLETELDDSADVLDVTLNVLVDTATDVGTDNDIAVDGGSADVADGVGKTRVSIATAADR